VKSAAGLTRLVPQPRDSGVAAIVLGRDLVLADGITPCQPGNIGCQVDVLGTQLEEVLQ
jgi:hypothetical protein